MLLELMLFEEKIANKMSGSLTWILSTIRSTMKAEFCCISIYSEGSIAFINNYQ